MLPEPIHLSHEGAFDLPVRREAALPLFTPEGERAWAPGWDAEIIHPAEGRGTSPPAGTVFVTRNGPRERVWILVEAGGAWDYRYVNVAAGHLVTEVRVRVDSLPDESGSRVRVAYAWTALSPEARRELAAQDSDWYAAFLGEWRAAILVALQRGRSAHP